MMGIKFPWSQNDKFKSEIPVDGTRFELKLDLFMVFLVYTDCYLKIKITVTVLITEK